MQTNTTTTNNNTTHNTTHTTSTNPFTIPTHKSSVCTEKEWDVEWAGIVAAFNALRDPASHSDAFHALLDFLNVQYSGCKELMERRFFEYMAENNIWDQYWNQPKASYVDDPMNYIGISDEESDLLFPEPDYD